jgi:hypothetical protein
VGAIGSLGLIGTGLIGVTSPREGLSFGGLGLTIAVAQARWRGPRDPSRWQVEHLTSLLAAYTVGWSFILAFYAGLQNATGLVVPALGIAGILWARRRFRALATDHNRAAELGGRASISPAGDTRAARSSSMRLSSHTCAWLQTLS